MKAVDRERRDWLILPVILLIGFLGVILAGQWALRFSARWTLDSNMQSNIDPNSEFLTRPPGGFFGQIDPAILTQPSWINVFLTPGALFVTGTPFPPRTATMPATTAAYVSATNTAVLLTTSPTTGVIYFPPTRTATARPVASTATSASTQIPTTLATLTNTSIAASTATQTATATATRTNTATATATLTATGTATGTATFTPTATASATETGTATATPTATFTPVPIPTDPTPGTIGTWPDGSTYDLPAGGTLTLGINLVANGDGAWDLVYYEYPVPGGILLDWAVVQISDGTTWYTIFNWGDNVADTNTNVNFNILSNPQDPPEPDQRPVSNAELYGSTGIAIDLDSVVPPGTYSYLRFTAPPGDVDNQMEIDAIEILP